jgi:hypothetical protein
VRIPPWVPGSVCSLLPSSVRIPAFGNAPMSARTRLSPIRSLAWVHGGDVRELVEARHDVRLDHPLVGAAGEEVNFGDRALGSAPRPEAVGAGLELRLEQRLEQQLEGGLNHPVGNGGEPSRRVSGSTAPAPAAAHPPPRHYQRGRVVDGVCGGP